jgi:hypothetical protein
MEENKLIEAINFAFQTVIEDERFLDSGLTPEDAEIIVYDIITTQFPKCFNTLGAFMIKDLEDNKELD